MLARRQRNVPLRLHQYKINDDKTHEEDGQTGGQTGGQTTSSLDGYFGKSPVAAATLRFYSDH